MRSLLLFFIFCTCAPALLTSAVPTPVGVVGPEAEPLITNSYVFGENIRLGLANLEGVRTRVEISSLASGERHFFTLVKNHNGYGANFDLTELDYGRYAITITKGATVRHQVVLKSETGIMCSEWK